ncbi:MAG: adenylosuccinate lyase, partial [Planctomycetota bacterium]
NREELHERIRLHSQAAASQVKSFGRPNDLVGRLKADIAFAKIDFEKILDPDAYIGRSAQQVGEFIRDIVTPIRKKYRRDLNRHAELNV